jgi:hypothetical protein
MNQYVVAIHNPDNFDASKQDPSFFADIAALNAEMKSANVRIYFGGMEAPAKSKSLRVGPAGKITVTDGPYLEAKEHVGGFWVLGCADIEEALVWARKAAVACRAAVEVRQIFQMVPIDWPRV